MTTLNIIEVLRKLFFEHNGKSAFLSIGGFATL